MVDKVLLHSEPEPTCKTLSTVAPEDIKTYRLTAASGAFIDILNLGATINALHMPVAGTLRNIVLGHKNPVDYLTCDAFHGASIGRFCGRIRNGRFSLDNKRYQLSINNDGNHLHGGTHGLHSRIWEVESHTDTRLVFSITSPDGDQGYPGELKIQAIYDFNQLDDTHIALRLEYRATTDAPTILNLSNHSYFNLEGVSENPSEQGDILQHRFHINADRYTPICDALVPNGDIVTVENTPFDFRQPVRLCERIHQDHEQIRLGGGMDHNFVLAKPVGEFGYAARIGSPNRDLLMCISTEKPGLQFYSANMLGAPYPKYGGFCMEAQNYPDGPNHPHFPSTRLNPGDVYSATTLYEFEAPVSAS